MNLLLDTHAVLWWLADTELSAEARSAIADADRVVAVSAASVWEISIKRRLGKLEAPAQVVEAIAASRFEPLAITLDHADAAGALPQHHRDPFDRMLVAQARVEGLTLVTRDPAIGAYDVDTLAC